MSTDNTLQMLQAILKGQGALKQELLAKIDRVDQKVEKLTGKVDGLEGKLDKVEKNLTNRLDKIGKQLAYLEDDTPTRDEYDGLEKRVYNLEKKVTTNLL